MSKSIAVVDSVEVQKECFVIRGWFYIEQKKDASVGAGVGNTAPVCSCQLNCGKEVVEIPCSFTRVRREDVVEARADLPFEGTDVGFWIQIPELDHYLPQNAEKVALGSLHVQISNGCETLEILHRSIAEVQEIYAQSKLLYHVENVGYREGNVEISGWCIPLCGKVNKNASEMLTWKVFDGTHDITKEATLVKGRRTDVAAAYEVEAERCIGFVLRIPRKAVQGKEVLLVLENTEAARKISVDLRTLDKEHGIFQKWLKLLKTRPDFEKRKEWKRQRKEVFSQNVKFSIVVPLYHTPFSFLKEMLDSVVKQSYQNWELCLADGSKDDSVERYIQKHYGREKRIHYRHLEENTGISGNTNEALKMVTGDYVVFADHDDKLYPDALYQAAKALSEAPEAELLYTDEELVDKEGKPTAPHFKPDFNLDYLRCVNYICHLLIVKCTLLEQVGFLRKEYDGAQDYDFILRCVEQTSKIQHIPKILYQWRSHENSTAGNQDSKGYAVEAGKHALEAHYKRMDLKAEVEFTGLFLVYRTKFALLGNPKISILIPNKDHVEDLKKCMDSIFKKSSWKNFEIIIIENNSEEAETFAYYETLRHAHKEIKIVTYMGEFNYSVINNFGATVAEGEYLLLLNNDTEVISENWMEKMLELCQREDVGAVGAKLYYPDDTVQHAGIVVGMGGFAGHLLTGCDRKAAGYLNRLRTMQEVSAVTGACMMVKRSVYEALGGLDEAFAVALNDVDFCLRVRNSGKLVAFQPDAELYHYESKSRGFESTSEKQARFDKEIKKFQKRYETLLEKGDPYYNPNLTLKRSDCSVKRAGD